MVTQFTVGGAAPVRTEGRPFEIGTQLQDQAVAEQAPACPLPPWSILNPRRGPYSAGGVKWYYTGSDLGEVREAKDQMPAIGNLDRPEIPIAVHMYCAQKDITGEVEETIGVARSHFKMVGKPHLDVVCDPEYGESYIAIHIWAHGETDDVFKQGQSFARVLRNSVSRNKLNFIRLIYHAI